MKNRIFKTNSKSRRLSFLPIQLGFVVLVTLLSVDLFAQTSLNFDGVDDQVITSEDFMITGSQQRTIEAWIKTTSMEDQVIVMWGIDFSGKKCVLRLDEGYLRYESGDGPTVGTETLLNDGNWHHVAAVLPADGSTVNDIIMYVDGEVEAHPGHFRLIDTQPSPLIIGNSSINNDRFFDGSIDELRIWNIERTAEEIAFYMDYELCDETGLVARYTMDEGVAGGDNTALTSIIDNIDGNNGTLENFGKEFDNSNWVNGIIPERLEGIDVQYICEGGSMTWIDGITYNTDNNTATELLVGGASNMCDSLVTLDLSVVAIDPTLTVSNATMTANQSGASYQWMTCDLIAIDNADEQTYTPTENGSYAVEITLNGCSEISECVEITTVGIEEYEAFRETSIYPNPNKGYVNIELGNLDKIDIKVVDVNGKLIYQQAQATSSTVQFELNAPAGTYLVEISAEGMSKQYRIVKQN